MKVRGNTPFVAALSALMALSPALVSAQAAAQTRITQSGGVNATALTLAFGKSAIVDLPSDARDVMLSNPQIADAVVRTPRRIYVIGRALGQTNAFFFDAAGNQIASLDIRVEPDVSALNDVLLRHAPGTRVRAEALNGSIVLSGSVRSPAEADAALQVARTFLGIAGGSGAGNGDMPGGMNSPGTPSPGGSQPRIVNLIQVEGSEQVLVRVRIVEMSRSLVRQLGVNFDAANIFNSLLPDEVVLNALTGNGFSVSGAGLGGLAAGVGITGDGSVIDASIQAFERAGLVRVLAEPNLTAISGENARFLAGGEFPIPVAQEDDTLTVEFKPFGVGLAFTPLVLSGGRISLKMSTEVSDLTPEGAISTGGGISIPALQVRRAETTLEMPSGGSMVLAGLIQERTREAFDGIPGIMNVPVLGTLFRSRDFVNNETELVIIVTPYLVRSTSPGELRTAGDGYRNPTEVAGNFMGRLNAVYGGAQGGAGDGGARQLHGRPGHVVP